MHFLSALAAVLPLAYAQSSSPPVTNSSGGALRDAQSPPKYPSPWGEGLGEWADAYAKAKDFVSQLTLLEKVNLTTGWVVGVLKTIQ